MMSRLVPKLRFKEFSGEWKERKLGDVGNTFNGLTGKTKEDFGIGKPYIQYMQVFSNYKIDVANFGLVTIKPNDRQNKVKYGDIFFTTSSETLKEIGLSSVLTKQVNEVYLNSFCFGYRPKSLDELVPEFSQFFFRNETVRKKIIGLGQGSTRVNISKVKLLELKFYFPEKQEQQKIASCLSSLDALIEAQNKKVSALKQHKKGLMQQLFPAEGEREPKLRFKAFSGAWVEKKLGDVGSFKSGVGFTEFEQGGKLGVPFFKVSDMNLESNQKVMTLANNYVSDEQIARLNYKPINKKSVIFAKVGAAVFLERKRVADSFLIDNNMMAFTPITHIDFIRQWFDTVKLSKYAQVGALPSYNASDLKIIKIKLPKPKEQQKIANTLSTLDNLIEAQNQKIAQLKQHKKALMQQMFVSNEVGA